MPKNKNETKKTRINLYLTTNKILNSQLIVKILLKQRSLN